METKCKKVRHCSTEPTPYLRKMTDMGVMRLSRKKFGVDLACGNGRNSRYLLAGFPKLNMLELDPHPGRVGALHWDAAAMIPCHSHRVDIVLCQYMLMFLTEMEQEHLLAEICRVARDGCVLILEVENIKSGCRKVNLTKVIWMLQAMTHFGQWSMAHRTSKRCTLVFKSGGAG